MPGGWRTGDWLASLGARQWGAVARGVGVCGGAVALAEKAALTGQFLQRKMAEYEKLREEIEALQTDSEQVNAAFENIRI